MISRAAQRRQQRQGWPGGRRRRAFGLALVVLIVPVAGVALTGDAPPSRDPLLVRSWITTADAEQPLAEQPPVAFGDVSTDPPLTIAVDPTRRYQVIDGFGASITDSSAGVLHRMDPRTRDAAMVELFDPRRGAGLSYLRQPMGASDFVDADFYTYDDVAPGGTDYAMEHFSIEHDQEQILPLLRRAKELNPRLRIVASPWTAPAWMKTNGSLIGGSLIDDARIYRAYALYFVRFLRAYAAAGAPVDAVTVQNEPQHATTDYPGMLMSPAQQAAFISVLGPTLEKAGLRVTILAYDHNWSLSPADASGAPGAVSGEAYAGTVLSDPRAARWVDGVAFHCYAGAPGIQAEVHRAHPDAQILLSECSGYRRPGESASGTFARSLRRTAQLVIGATRNWARGVLTWNLALGPAGGPHRGGCGVCTGLLTVGPGNDVTWNAEYYALASVSRVVRPGGVRIASTSLPGAGNDGGLITAAFRNLDGSIALVAYNMIAGPRRFAVQVGNRSFSTTLAGGALGTYSWSSAATPDGAAVLLDPSEMTTTASPAAPSDPCCTGDTADRAADDDVGTRWSTGESQQPGQYLQLDLGKGRRVARVVLDAGVAAGDAPNRWSLLAGDDPTTLGRPVAEGAGARQLTSIDLSGVDARYLRISITDRSSSWWSVAEVRVFVLP